MKCRLSILLLGALVCGGAPAQTFTDLKGNWKAVWDIDGTTTLRFYLKITKSGTVYSGTMDDLDEGYNNMPAVGITASSPSVQFDFSNYGFVYQGNLNSNFTQITGTWSDGPDTWPLVFEREPSVDEMQARTYSGASGTLPYRLFVPANYAPGTRYPLVLFLHGAGERGTDNRAQITGQSGVLAFLFNENQAKQPCFLAAPQCPTSGNWSDSTRHAQLPALIAALKSEFNIDADRVYITGLSLGGAGTWDMLALNGNLFAAGIPLSGYPGSLTVAATAAAACGIPIWNFHAADDTTVSIANSRNLIGGIRNLGGMPIYTEFATGGHVIWSAAYATPLLYDWLIAQKRGSVTNLPPFVTITAPSDQPYVFTTNSATSLGGIAGDATTLISQITWTNSRGGSGLATGTNSSARSS
jgi:acetyl esterase/lipase